LTLAATDVCEDPAQYGRFSAPWTGIQQITNGVHIDGDARLVRNAGRRRSVTAASTP